MKRTHRFLISLLLLCLCFAMITGVTYSWFVSTGSGLSSASGDGIIKIGTGSVSFEMDPELRSSSSDSAVYELKLINSSTLPTHLTLTFVPVWQEEDPAHPGQYIDLPLAPDNVTLWSSDDGLIFDPIVGGVYGGDLPPWSGTGDGDGYSVFIKVQTVPTAETAGLSLYVKVFADAETIPDP